MQGDRILCQKTKTSMHADGRKTVVTARVESIRGQMPYFAITFADYTPRGRMEACGTDAAVILKAAKEWHRYTRWHLVDVMGKPMHYKANAIYFAGFGKYHHESRESFESTVVFGALPTDDNVDPLVLSQETLEGWLDSRLDGLRTMFWLDMIELFGANEWAEIMAEFMPAEFMPAEFQS